MYEVLYNKYRPERFGDVIAQEAVTQVLRHQVQNKQTARAYLFTGAAGTGKTTCARILAKAVNCLNPVDGDPCLECEHCKLIAEGASDIAEIDAASNNSVNDVRELREALQYMPAQLNCRVYIIDEAHALSRDAWSALLKTLEEPPEHVLFILATTETHKVPATILSRCQQFTFKRVGAAESAAHLLKIAENERFDLETSAAMLIARLSAGGMRDALRLLDTAAGADRHITTDIVLKCSGASGTEHLFGISEAAAIGDVQTALTVLDGLYAESKDMRRLAEELIEHYRNLLVLKLAPNTRFDFLPEERKRYEAGGEGYTPQALLTLLTACEDCLERIVRAGSDRAAVEICIITLCGVMSGAQSQQSLFSAESPSVKPAQDVVTSRAFPAQSVGTKPAQDVVTSPPFSAQSPSAKPAQASIPSQRSQQINLRAATQESPKAPPHFDNEYPPPPPEAPELSEQHEPPGQHLRHAPNPPTTHMPTAKPIPKPIIAQPAVPAHLSHLPESIRAAVLQKQGEQSAAQTAVNEAAKIQPPSGAKQTAAEFLQKLKDGGVTVREM
jgi:DNA polymerase-3 subunit gamma/tau